MSAFHHPSAPVITGNLDILGSMKRKKLRRERRAERERLNDSGATPIASGSSTPLSKSEEGELKILGAATAAEKRTAMNETNSSRTFAEGDDFIPFNFSGPEDEDVGTTSKGRSDRKGKGRDVEERADVVPANSRVGRSSEREKDAKSKSSRTQEHNRDVGRSTGRDSRYERGKEGDSGRKRKYDEYDDGYANKKERMDAASRKCPWVKAVDLDKCHNVAEMMHKEVGSFVDWISPTPVEDEIRGLIVAHIRNVITTAFPDAVVYPFGSYQTKLYLPLGDIDLVILSDSMAYSDKSIVLHALANTLKRNGITNHVTIIAKAKVPIVKFVTSHGRFKVDISINQANGLISGKMITGFLKDMIPNLEGKESKALRSLIMVTKAFLNQRSMNEVYTGGLGSYAIVCLAVSFLQMHPKIRAGEIDPEKNLGVLIVEFFELYGNHFNYDEVGISLREGGTYFNKRQRGWHAEYKRNMLSIEDPADPTNDISAGSYNFHKVRTAFAGCHGILTSTAYLRAGILSSRLHGQSVRLRSRYEPEDLSILATVMGVTQETINHRKIVQELYDKRVIHRIVGVPPLPLVVIASKQERKPQSASTPTVSHSSEKVPRYSHDAGDSESEDDFHIHTQYPDDDSGRYSIERQPPRKRRKMGRAGDNHTVYIMDDDDTEDARQDDIEDGEYLSDSTSSREEQRQRSRGSNDRNGRTRSYWLSKGLGVEGGIEDD